VLSSSQIVDGSGRVVVHMKDDRGEPEDFNNPVVVSFAQQATFTERITIPMNRDETKGSFRLGTLLLNAQIIPGPTFTGTLLALEVLVIGYVGTAPTTIKSTVFGAFLAQDVVTFDDGDSYDTIGIMGRQVVDGLPDGTTPVATLTLQVAGRFTR
jgi:hypothetical protein